MAVFERLSERLSDWWSGWRDRLTLGDRGDAVMGRVFGRFRLKWLWLPLVLILLYFPIGMILVQNVDDDIEFAVPEKLRTPGGSHAVDIAAALIDREVNDHEWVANEPFFKPGSKLDNMPNFQQGLVSALARFAFELTDQIGRARGSSQADTDLQEAAGLLQYSGTKWMFDFSTSLAPTATSEAQYRKARASLLAYNRRLAAGDAMFERRADNLLATLDRIALDLGSVSAVLDQAIAEGGGWFDFNADDIFYNAKGKMYGYRMLLRELRRDFDNVVAERQLAVAWDQALASLALGAEMDPLVVVNGSPDSLVLPSHLAAQGFYLLRARTQLREITNILLK